MSEPVLSILYTDTFQHADTVAGTVPRSTTGVPTLATWVDYNGSSFNVSGNRLHSAGGYPQGYYDRGGYLYRQASGSETLVDSGVVGYWDNVTSPNTTWMLCLRFQPGTGTASDGSRFQ